MKNLKNKIVLVTGGGQGLGKAITEVLSNEHAIVIAADIKEDTVKELAKQLFREGKKVHAKVLNVTDSDSCKRIVEEIVHEFGQLDILINNAGIDVTKPLTGISLEEFDRVIQVNLRAPFFLSKLVFPIMASIGGGNIVNITSTAAKRTWPNASAYHASKWGLLGLSHALHTEGRQHNIAVTAIIAGGMSTPFILERFPETPLDVLQDPRNVAEVVKYILMQPQETVIPEVMVLPKNETSWP